MKNEIIFGLSGSGKTGYLVDKISKFIDNNENYLIVILEEDSEILHRLPENYKNNSHIIFKSGFEEMLLEGINNKINKKLLFIIDDKLKNNCDMYLSHLINLLTYYGNVLITVQLNKENKNISEIKPVLINNHLNFNFSNFINIFLNK